MFKCISLKPFCLLHCLGKPTVLVLDPFGVEPNDTMAKAEAPGSVISQCL